MTYITHLTNPHQTNAYASHVGVGRTSEEAVEDSCYHANQLPWVRTVSWSRAPRWAQAEAAERLAIVSAREIGCTICGRQPVVALPRRFAEHYYCGCEGGSMDPRTAAYIRETGSVLLPSAK